MTTKQLGVEVHRIPGWWVGSVGRIQVQGKCEVLLKNNQSKRAGDSVQVAEYLPGKFRSCTTKKKKKREKERSAICVFKDSINMKINLN
jgi:hypothetical protein